MVQAPSETVSLYRGTDRGRARVMSWTDDRVGAEHYRRGRLNRDHPVARVYRGVPDVRSVLAVFHRGNDTLEYVLDPDLPGDVELIERGAADGRRPKLPSGVESLDLKAYSDRLRYISLGPHRYPDGRSGKAGRVAVLGEVSALEHDFPRVRGRAADPR